MMTVLCPHKWQTVPDAGITIDEIEGCASTCPAESRGHEAQMKAGLCMEHGNAFYLYTRIHDISHWPVGTRWLPCERKPSQQNLMRDNGESVTLTQNNEPAQ